MDFDAVVFDMDGLLLDTERIYLETARQAAGHCRAILSIEQAMLFIGRRPAECKELLLNWFGQEFDVPAYWSRCRELTVSLESGIVPLKPGVVELLEYLAAQRLPMALATSGRSARAKSMLGNARILHHFRQIACGDDVTRGKPAPDVFLLAAQHLGLPPSRCLALEDSIPGILAAKAAGMKVWAIPDLQPLTSEASRAADKVLESLTDVLTTLKED